MPGRPARVCVIGLDAADAGLVERWSRQGLLPTLAALAREGEWITLRHRGEIGSGAVWPSIYTGAHPGRHGLCHTVGLRPGTWTLEPMRPDAAPVPPLWAVLDAAGLRSVVVDVPLSPSTRPFRGGQIADWGTYERLGRPRSLPPALLDEVVARWGPYPGERDLSRNPPLGDRQLARARARLRAGVAAKGRMLRWLAAHRPWDFFFGVFGEPHAAGHYFWHLEAPGAASRPPDARGGDTPVREIYRAVDAELGRIVETLDLATTAVLVVSGQGMGPNGGAAHLLGPVLAALGLQVPPAGARRGLVRRLRDACPAGLRTAVSGCLPRGVRTSMSGYWLADSADTARSRAVALPTDQLGRVRVNLAGREPAGLVAPGREYDELCAAIAGALERLVDPRTGRPVVREVFHTDRTFPGPESHRLPDLYVRWHDGDGPVEAVWSEEVGTVAGRWTDPRSGNHHPEGFAILFGAGARRGRRTDGHLLDVAPTVLDWLGL